MLNFCDCHLLDEVLDMRSFNSKTADFSERKRGEHDQRASLKSKAGAFLQAVCGKDQMQQTLESQSSGFCRSTEEG